MKKLLKVFGLLSAFFMLSILTANAETLTIEKQDLVTGETTTYELTEYPDDASYPRTEGFKGTLPIEEDEGSEAVPFEIIGDDDRNVVTNTQRVPYRYIGKLLVYFSDGISSAGTAFLVGPSTVLTAGHCVYSKDKTVTAIQFIPGMNGTSRPYGTIQATEIHVPAAFRRAVNDDDLANQIKYDYAVLELESAVGNQLGYFGLGGYSTKYDLDYLTGRQATIAGYPGYYGNLLYRHKATIAAFNSDGYVMYYDMDTEGGQSGSPVIFPISNNYYVVGIHTRAYSAMYNQGRYITKNIYELVNKYK